MIMKIKDIKERWTERIAGRYDQSDGSGVIPYLIKYGRNISDEKLEGYAQVAEEYGLKIVSQAFESQTSYGIIKAYGFKYPVEVLDYKRFFYYEKNEKGEEDTYDFFLNSCNKKFCCIAFNGVSYSKIITVFKDKLKESSFNHSFFVSYFDNNQYRPFVIIEEENHIEFIDFFICSILGKHVVIPWWGGYGRK